MKKSLVLFSAIFALLSFTSFSTLDPKTCTVQVKNGTITVQGMKVTPGWELSMFTAGLGDGDRIRDGHNRTHTYDKLGIVLFEPMVNEKGGGKITEFQIYFSVPESNNVTPTGDGFKGSYKVDKLTVTGNLTPAVMFKKLKGWKKTDSYMEHNYRMAKGAVYIYFLFNESETKLIKSSIGINKD